MLKVKSITPIKPGKYKLTWDNNQTMVLYEDTIVNMTLIPNKIINQDMLDTIIKNDEISLIYDKAIKYLKLRQRSKYELERYLTSKNYEPTLIKEVIDKLNNQGILNDLKFAQSYINDKLLMAKTGPYKLKQDLEALKVDHNIVNELIDNISEDVLIINIKKYINRIGKSSKASSFITKQKILLELINLGYPKNLIVDHLDAINIIDSHLIDKEYNRLYNKYIKKYNGQQLYLKIRNGLYLKGYKAEDIDNILNKKDFKF